MSNQFCNRETVLEKAYIKYTVYFWFYKSMGFVLISSSFCSCPKTKTSKDTQYCLFCNLEDKSVNLHIPDPSTGKFCLL